MFKFKVECLRNPSMQESIKEGFILANTYLEAVEKLTEYFMGDSLTKIELELTLSNSDVILFK